MVRKYFVVNQFTVGTQEEMIFIFDLIHIAESAQSVMSRNVYIPSTFDIKTVR